MAIFSVTSMFSVCSICVHEGGKTNVFITRFSIFRSLAESFFSPNGSHSLSMFLKNQKSEYELSLETTEG